jgi:Ca2+-transporting ATPase
VPEGLPAIVTAVLAIGTNRMAKRNAIVRHLAAVEALGSATVIASDKTGTLTENRMAVRAVLTADGRHSLDDAGSRVPDDVIHALTIADRASNATLPAEGPAHGDPTEIALREAARDAGIEDDEIDRRLPRLAEMPFSSARRMMSTIHRVEADGGTVVFTKGAPDVIIARCASERVAGQSRPLTSERRAALLAASEVLADEAMRMIAVASRRLEKTSGASPAELAAGEVERDLELAGIIGMTDPPRPAAREAVARAKSGGIRPIMITGDHPRTATVIARELGIGDGEAVLTGPQLDRMTDHELDKATAHRSVFARVSPEHKLRIVESLRRRHEVVAMTGDGVNDAPALKSADIGIAMGRGGTDAAREASDIVLADDNFATIVAAVEEGRAIYANIRKFLRYLLSSNIGEVLTMFLGMVLGRLIGLTAVDGTFAVPLLATQILWINLVTDGPPALALGVEPADPEVMRMPPRGRTESVITAAMWRGIFFVGLVMAVATLAVIDASLPGGLIPGSGTLGHARTMGFMTLMLAQLFNVFNARSETRSAFGGARPAPWLWASLALSLVLQAAVIHVPTLQRAFGTEALSASDWGLCLLAASSVLVARETGKAARRRRRTPARTPAPAR